MKFRGPQGLHDRYCEAQALQADLFRQTIP